MDYLKITDASVKSKTKKNWEQWFAVLDRMKAQELGHKEAARKLAQGYKLSPWWSQVVTTRYEKERGYWVRARA